MDFESNVRSIALFLLVCWTIASIQAAELNWREQFDQGLIQEEVHQDLEKAVEHYQNIVTAYDEQRDVLAMSMFRLAETLRKLGRIDEAAPLYERIIKEFPDKQSLILLSQRFVPTSKQPRVNPLIIANDDLLMNHAESLSFVIEQIKKASPDEAMQMLMEFTNDTLARNLLNQYRVAQAELAQLKTRYLDKWPAVRDQQQKISTLEEQMQEHADKGVRLLEIRLTALRQKDGVGAGGTSEGLIGNHPMPSPSRIIDRPETLRLFIQELEKAAMDVALQMLKEEAEFEVPTELLQEKSSAERGLSTIKEKHPLYESYKKRYDYAFEQLETFVQTSTQQLRIKLRVLENVVKSSESNKSTRLVDKHETLKVFIEELENASTDLAIRMLIQETDEKVLTNLFNERSTLATELKGMEKMHGPEHPRMQEQKAKLDSVQKQMKEFVDQSIEQLKIRLRILDRSSSDQKVKITNDLANPEEIMLNDLKTKARETPDLLTHFTQQGLAPIHRATMQGYLSVIDFLIEQGVDINSRDRSGKTALHHAVIKGSLEMVEYLIQIEGIDLNVVEPYHSAPLHIAAENGYLAIARRLIEAGADVNISSKINENSAEINKHRNSLNRFMAAIRQGLPKFRAKSHGSIQQKDLYGVLISGGNTPLHYSSVNGFTEMSDFFISHGADLNVTNRCGLTPLLMHLAHSKVAPAKQVQTTKLLLDSGSDPNIMGAVVDPTDRFNSNSLGYFMARRSTSTSLPRWLIKDSVFTESKFDDSDVLIGWTSALHVGVVLGDEIARVLIQYGANITQQDYRGWTPVNLVMTRSMDSFIRDELVKLGSGQTDVDPVVLKIQPDLKDNMGYRAIDWALFVERHIDSVKGLIHLIPEEKRDQVAYETFWNHFRNMKSRSSTQKFLGELMSEFPQLRTQPGPNDLLPLEQAVTDTNRELVNWLHEQGVSLVMTPLLQEKKKELETYFEANSNQIKDDTDRNKWVTLEILNTFEQP